MPVFIQNNGQPHLPPEQRRPFRIGGWHETIPVGGMVEVTEEMLARMSRPAGKAEEFAHYLAGIFNANREREWLSVIVDGNHAPPPTAPDPAPGPDVSDVTPEVAPSDQAGTGDQPAGTEEAGS